MNKSSRYFDDLQPIPSGVTRLMPRVDQKTLELLTMVHILDDEEFGEIALERYPNLSPVETLQQILIDYREWLESRHAEQMQEESDSTAYWIKGWRLKRARRKERAAGK